MLNYFYLYPITWIFVLFLYLLDFSKFNSKLDSGLILFIIFTSLISLFLGCLFRNKFKDLTKKDEKIHISIKPIIFLIATSILEFIIMRKIPFISIAILKDTNYNDLAFVPFLHIIISSFALYYAQRYIYTMIVSKENRKKAFRYFLVICFIFLLWYTRSSIMFALFSFVNGIIYYLKSNEKIKPKHIVVSVVVIFASLFIFGCLGNTRHGYKWNDNNYIKNLGQYNHFPNFIPKQYMWSYSYVTSPLANLNYNVLNKNTSSNMAATFSQLAPETISKRNPLAKKRKSCALVKNYFTASTSYCLVYTNGSYLGMMVYFLTLMLLGVFGVILYNKKIRMDCFIYCTFMSIIYVFMFFDNMLYFVGVSIPFWMSFLVLLHKYLYLRKYDYEK